MESQKHDLLWQIDVLERMIASASTPSDSLAHLRSTLKKGTESARKTQANGQAGKETTKKAAQNTNDAVNGTEKKTKTEPSLIHHD